LPREIAFDMPELQHAAGPVHRVAVLLSGGNIERARFRQVFGAATPPAA
jgi:hypothetical protein